MRTGLVLFTILCVFIAWYGKHGTWIVRAKMLKFHNGRYLWAVQELEEIREPHSKSVCSKSLRKEEARIEQYKQMHLEKAQQLRIEISAHEKENSNEQ